MGLNTLILIIINTLQHCCTGGVIIEDEFTELNFTERVYFPLDQGRQEMPVREISLNRVVEEHGMVRREGV